MALIFLLFFSGLSAGAQYFPIHENDFILLKGVKYTLNRMTRESKNRDTTYLWLAPPELKIKLSYNFQEAGMKLDWDFKYDEDVTDLEGHTTMETVPGRVRSDLLGNLTKYMGLKFSYAGVSFGMSIWKDKSKKHKNKSFSFGYKKGHWMFDFKYLKTRGNIGYRIITGDDPSSIHYSNNEYESEYDCRMKYYQFDAYYAINRRHFAIDAAYGGRSIQRRSSGSWMLATRYTQGHFKLNPKEYLSYSLGNIGSYNNYQASVGAGYSYNVVFCHRNPRPVPYKAFNSNARQGLRNVTLSVTMIPLITAFNQISLVPIIADTEKPGKYVHGEAVHIGCNPRLNMIGRASLGISVNQFTFGAKVIYDRLNFKSVHAAYDPEGSFYDIHWKGLFFNWRVSAFLTYHL